MLSYMSWPVLAGFAGMMVTHLLGYLRARGADKRAREDKERAAFGEDRSAAFRELKEVVAVLKAEVVDLRGELDAEQERRRLEVSALRAELEEERRKRIDAEAGTYKIRFEMHQLRNELQKQGISLPQPRPGAAPSA